MFARKSFSQMSTLYIEAKPSTIIASVERRMYYIITIPHNTALV